MMKYSARISLAAWLALAAGCGGTGPSADLAIENVTIIDALNGAREGQTVLVEDGMITGVMASGEAADAAEIVDALETSCWARYFRTVERPLPAGDEW